MNVFIAEVTGQRGVLTAEESWHCSRVLRKSAGDVVNLIDGAGNFYEAVLDVVSDKECRVKITKGPMPQDEPGYYLHLAIAPTKQIDRIEWMIEKAVEVGIQELTFLQCHNSERTSVKHERIMKIVESAVKQSLQARIPKVNGLITFRDLMKHHKADQKLIAHCFEGQKKHLRSFEFRSKNTLVMVGPEGDFSREEVDQALEKGFEAITLGTTRLRTETAGLYICQAASLFTIT